MKQIEVFQYTSWRPLTQFGLTADYWTLNGETILSTWLVISILLVSALLIRVLLRRKHTVVTYLVHSIMRYFMEMVEQSLGMFHVDHFLFAINLFLFIVCCNSLGAFLPGVEEPTADLNTTVALALCSFIYVQIYSIKTHGLLGYLKEYVSPMFLLLPLNIVGKLASIISLSFRLFGNILGGSIISQIYQVARSSHVLVEFACLASGLNLLITGFFGLFEGLIQAFVFSMITLTYLATGIHGEG